MVATKSLLSATTKLISPNLRLHTLTNPLMEHAPTMKALHTKTSKLLAVFKLHPVQFQPFKPLLLNNQLPCQLKPTLQSSNHTHQEYLTALLAELHLITPFSLPAMVQKTDRITGSSRTHGALHGVKTDISRLPPSMVPVSVVFNWLQSTQPLLEEYFDLNLIQFILS
jgi:hypothetical protein